MLLALLFIPYLTVLLYFAPCILRFCVVEILKMPCLTHVVFKSPPSLCHSESVFSPCTEVLAYQSVEQLLLE